MSFSFIVEPSKFQGLDVDMVEAALVSAVIMLLAEGNTVVDCFEVWDKILSDVCLFPKEIRLFMLFAKTSFSSTFLVRSASKVVAVVTCVLCVMGVNAAAVLFCFTSALLEPRVNSKTSVSTVAGLVVSGLSVMALGLHELVCV